MKHETENPIAILRQRGYRVTEARVAIIDSLIKQEKPQTVMELAAKLEADETTVYRTIAMLLEEGLAEEISGAGGESRFAIAHGHHHHLICTTCGRTEHLPCFAPTIPQKHSFSTVTDHEVTFYGLCKVCS